MIISCGKKIYPCKVEDVLHEYPAAQDVAVLGILDEKREESVLAFIVPKASNLTAQVFQE